MPPSRSHGLQEPIGRSVNSALSSKTGRRIVYVLVFLWTIPTFGVFVSSFRDEIDVKTTGWWTFLWNPHFTLDNYKSVLGSEGGGDNLSHFFLNSLRITIPATVISVGIALLAAYAFSWMQFKGRDWLYVAVIAMLVVPLQMSLVTLSRLFNGGAHIGTFTIFPDLNLNNSVVPIWIAHTCFGMPFCIFILKNFVSSLPREIIEAARVDGAEPPHDLLQAGVAVVGSGRGVAVHLPVRLHLERPADRPHLRRLRQPADHRQDGRGVGLAWPVVAPADCGRVRDDDPAAGRVLLAAAILRYAVCSPAPSRDDAQSHRPIPHDPSTPSSTR